MGVGSLFKTRGDIEQMVEFERAQKKMRRERKEREREERRLAELSELDEGERVRKEGAHSGSGGGDGKSKKDTGDLRNAATALYGEGDGKSKKGKERGGGGRSGSDLDAVSVGGRGGGGRGADSLRKRGKAKDINESDLKSTTGKSTAQYNAENDNATHPPPHPSTHLHPIRALFISIQRFALRNAIILTFLQTIQMVIGMAVVIYHLHLRQTVPNCDGSDANLLLGGIIYGSYFALFTQFLVCKYFGGGRKERIVDQKEGKKIK
jgi:hypothetical protein